MLKTRIFNDNLDRVCKLFQHSLISPQREVSNRFFVVNKKFVMIHSFHHALGANNKF